MAPIKTQILVSVLLLVLLPQTEAVLSCPSSEFILWKEYCYSCHNDEPLSWDMAREKCLAKSVEGAKVDLISIHSAEENQFLVDQCWASDTWIGLYRVSNGVDEFKWSDGSVLDYERWSPGQPDNSHGKEDRGEMWSSDLHSWNDNIETRDSNYACKSNNVYRWQKEGDHEFFIKHGDSDNSLNWYEAREWCNENGGELTSIHSKEDVDIINNWLKFMGATEYFWIGLNKLDGDRTAWIWSDYTTVNFTNWESGYPKEGHTNLHCGSLKGDNENGKWYNDHCDDVSHGYICKRLYGDDSTKTPRPPVTVDGHCPLGYTEAGNKCFQVHIRDSHVGSSWSEAAIYCQQRTGFLADIASINNHFEQVVINSLLENSKQELWIGLYRTEAGSKTWLWNDNSPADYLNWGQNEPGTDNDLCAEVRPNATSHGSWGSKNCGAKQGFICQISIDEYPTMPTSDPGYCPPSWIPVGDSCYILKPNLHLRWVDARQYCHEKGTLENKADLVIIHDNDENFLVNAEMHDRASSPGNNRVFWLGLVKERPNAPYLWVDGTSLANFSNWQPGEPDAIHDGAQNCVEQDMVSGKWSDTHCGEFKGFACQIPKGTHPTTPAPSACPSDWLPGAGHCYLFKPNLRLEWMDARIHCRENGSPGKNADLLTIVDFSEEIFINAMYEKLDRFNESANFWIGLGKKKSDAPYTWVDGTTLDSYSNWYPGEPDKVGDCDENCVQEDKHTGKWADTDCSLQKGFVCKMDQLTFG